MIYRFNLEKKEYVFGLTANDGIYSPFQSGFSRDLNVWHGGNQAAAIILTTHGRYIFSKSPFKFEMFDDYFEIESNDEIELTKTGDSLKSAYLDIVKKYFVNTKKHPNLELFRKPQYNTWIEMPYECTEDKVLEYAQSIINNGFPAGVLMIDDCWCEDYGTREFDRKKFSNPKEMIKKLHDLGFKVMLWSCPFVSPDSKKFRELENLGYLVKNQDNTTYISHWWNGYSAVYDLSNQNAFKYFQNELDKLVEKYKVDGFKIDAGDPEYYRADNKFANSICVSDQARLLSKLGEKYSFSELRVGFNNGISPVANRLRDKNHSWTNEGINTLIMDGISLGLLGYPFLCPDMIGGGMLTSFEGDSFSLDQELFVKYSTLSAFFPMMQFSLSPWKVLDKEHLEFIIKSVEIHNKYSDIIEEEVKKSALSGEPIIRHLVYEYANDDYANVNDEFLIGSDILVCPMITKGNKRTVIIPSAKWMDEYGKIYEQGTYEVEIPLGEAFVLRKMK